MIHYVRDNETGYQDFQLHDADGAYNGTSATVALVLRDRHGGIVNTTSKVAWIVASEGTVRVSPAAGDLVASRGPYSAAFVVTVDSRTYAFPSSGPFEWRVWG